jgi:hypothetical protein
MDNVTSEGPGATPPVSEEEMDLLAEAQLDEDFSEEEEAEEVPSPEDGPGFEGGE